MVHRVAEAVEVLVDRRPARLGRERERRAALAVAVGGLRRSSVYASLIGRVVREAGHVLDGQPHCCCCASWVASAAGGHRAAREERLRDAPRRPRGCPTSSSPSVAATPSPETSSTLAVLELGARAGRGPGAACPGRPAIRSTARGARAQAVEHRAREVGRADQLLRDRERLERRAVPADVRLEGAARLEQRDQLVRARGSSSVERDRDRVARARRCAPSSPRARGGARAG